MSKKNFFLILGIALVTFSNAMAASNIFNGPTKLSDKSFTSNITILGPTKIKECHFQNLIINGPTSLEDAKVAGNLEIRGPAKLEELTIKGNLSACGRIKFKEGKVAGNVNIFGPAKLTNINIGKELKINGPGTIKASHVQGPAFIANLVKAEETTFNSSLTLNSNQMVVADCTTQDVVVKKNSLSYETQVLILQGNTHIHGTITFEAGKGIVKKGKNVTYTGLYGADVEGISDE